MISLIMLMRYSKINTFREYILKFTVFGFESDTYRFSLRSLLKLSTKVKMSIGIHDYFEISCKQYTNSFLPSAFPLSSSDPYFPHRKMLGEIWSQSHYIYLDLNPLSPAEIFLNHMRSE